MRRGNNRVPVDYRFCRDTVTLYHHLPGPEFSVVRMVYRGAFYDRSLNRKTTESGTGYESCFLLVLPAVGEGRPEYLPPEKFDQLRPGERTGRFTLAPGDKLTEGEGPEVTTAADWVRLDPRQGAALVKETAERRWMGRLAHIEAGGAQLLGKSSLPHPRKGSMR